MSNLKISTLSNLAGTQSTAIENAINGSAKAWVNFNGTGTVSIRASYNVSSITDNGTGQYVVNFTNAMPDTNYACVVSGYDSGGATAVKAQPQRTTTTTTQPIDATNAAGLAFSDLSSIMVAVFR